MVVHKMVEEITARLNTRLDAAREKLDHEIKEMRKGIRGPRLEKMWVI